MRILKKKIAQAQSLNAQHLSRRENSESTLSVRAQKATAKPSSPSKKRTRIPGVIFTPQNVRSTKNIVKNFGQAICRFILSDLAIPYINPYLEQEKTDIRHFKAYIKATMRELDSLFHFRLLLMVTDNDSQEVKAYKRLFKIAGEVFIKYFSVNWIYNSKVQHKMAHLMFRFKMLRRIQSPELFTYLKSHQGDS